MASSSEEGPAEPGLVGDSGGFEPLACTICRSRKLKCDRTKPACTRCAKAGIDCLYPESRRKPAFKRRNVKELEERLALVEGFLQNASKRPGVKPVGQDGAQPGSSRSNVSPSGTTVPNLFIPDPRGASRGPAILPPRRPSVSDSSEASFVEVGRDAGNELIGLGRFEGLPPTDVIEALHRIFFSEQQNYIPILNKTRYLRAFYAAPHMRPPMCLQYAIWAMAANGHPTYGIYHDIFYQRARQYLEADEMKGAGEHFLSVFHAQAWALTATDEARSMRFTRAAMSSARCVRLVEMMGFHRLDDPYESEHPITPTVVPPVDWLELEERRRIFWAAFCMDSHASINTGWPTLVDLSQVTARLPSSEDAFENGTEEETVTLSSVFSGSSYSTFAGVIVTCHLFIRLLKHIHRSTPDDHPEDADHGRFWNRHRELDNALSSTFMFLPERFRLPRHIRDPPAVHQNLNLHAAVICLHNAACDTVDRYGLPAHIKDISRTRCLTAAHEIVNIMKLTSHINVKYKTPLVALSLYCAASVFISVAKEKTRQRDAEINSLEFLIRCMELIGRQHIITRAYLDKLVCDIAESGLPVPFDATLSKGNTICGHRIPLIARRSILSPVTMLGPLPLGTIPGGGIHTPAPCSGTKCGTAGLSVPLATCGTHVSISEASDTTGNKRKRSHPSQTTSNTPNPAPAPAGSGMYFSPAAVRLDQAVPLLGTRVEPNPWSNWSWDEAPVQHANLPHRGTTPSGNTPSPSASTSGPTASTPATQSSNLRFSVTSSSEFLFEAAMTQAPAASSDTVPESDPSVLQGMDQWDGMDVDPELFAQVAAAMMMQDSGNNRTDGFATSQGSTDPWTQFIGDDNSGQDSWNPPPANG